MSLFGSLFQIAATAIGFAVGGPIGAGIGAAIGSIPNANEAKRDANKVKNIKNQELNLQRARASAQLSKQIRQRRASVINRGAAFGTLGASTTTALTPIFQSQFDSENTYLNTQTDLAVQQNNREAKAATSAAYSSVINAGVQGYSLGTSINGTSANSSLSADINSSISNNPNLF